ncbi:hypothetical protein [Methylobacillus flagellatus]|uniref:Uncharacterized protein n=3 Tax=root TaxID=1 RepID=Q1H2Q1_METFK|nr:hypothetical protein [Methylobacillus flagellatus]ABE49092.1 hypothetical protein Mfla_0824 [Methylobacillus flagellatus KT]ABE49236.1 hypothetical protein Mfla_0968 [Methylobacillus flagellatus KT]ABZ07153.1 hypothetical protein ALOHA_HF4000ANIW133B20ctg2g4 [uncultured marine microorganism HF4000_ANIW133B20]ABZ07576.1 hypothetical protein ALOHA_HF4000ANIW137K11ctg1g3 [uncultured marine microorganism HF4000_ANIW137K11]
MAMPESVSLTGYKGSASATFNENIQAPLTLQDIDTPLAVNNVAGSKGVNIGDGTFFGGNFSAGANSVISFLDGGAIDLAGKSVDTVAGLTVKFLDAVQQANIQALGFAEKAGNQAMQYVSDSTNPELTQEKLTNKTLWVVAGLAALYFYFNRKR